ncbi:hypothetical protein Daus18300_008247 [Diaporthe australafricana]|uniref:Transposase n=1 Tax=Diaporthe australafricana TaxID=127596 RepID=A0ABR3WJA3_9PEZI
MGQKPPHDLWFSGGSPLHPSQLCTRQQRFLRLTVRTRLFESAKPSTHYWFSSDMEWWFSVAKQVLDDIHLLLTRQSPADKARLCEVFLCRDLVRGPWNDKTWLSHFIHRYYTTEGTILYPFRNQVDKHLKNLPDTLRFDIFLLQCWSKMTLSPEQKRTFETIYEMNDEAMGGCMKTMQAYIERTRDTTINPNRLAPSSPGAISHIPRRPTSPETAARPQTSTIEQGSSQI